MTLIADPETATTKRTPGRPRSEASRAAVLKAAYAFLESHPVGEISVLQIARAAGASTATVYRWWPDKETLLLEAFLERVNHSITPESTGTPLERLRQGFMRTSRLLRGKTGIVTARLLTALQDDLALRNEFNQRVQLPWTGRTEKLVQEAITAGELPRRLKPRQFIEMLYSPLIIRLLLRTDPITESFAERQFAQVLLATNALAESQAKRK